MEIRYQGNSRIFLIAFFGLLMVCSSYLIYFFNPLKLIINTAIRVTDGSITFKIWERPPYDVYLRVYIFNVTNYEAFLEGKEKLNFQEIGPYVFQEYLTNNEPVFNDNETLTFVPRRTVKFIPELSINDPKDQYVLVPNIPLLGITSMLHQSSMFLNLAALSATRVANAQPILNLTVHDFFWGYEDNLVLAASRVLPRWIHFEKFGILDRMFDEGNNTVTINLDPNRHEGSPLIDEQERGRLYSIQTWNGSPGLAQWGYQIPENNEPVESNSKCNMLEGAYDGTLFPPRMTEDMKFRLYRKIFCRTVPIELDHVGTTDDNFDAYYYRIMENFLYPHEENPDNECYCKDKNFCLPSGLGDATPCYYGFPAAVSRPHMMGVDPEVVAKVSGMHPDEEKHGTYIAIHPEIGLVMHARSRMQINLKMWQTKYNSKTAPFNNMVLPLVWFELSVSEVPPNLHFLMTLMFKVAPVVQIILMYLLAIVGASLVATAGILVFITITSEQERSPSISLGYAAFRAIPVIRRESWIRDIRRHTKRDSTAPGSAPKEQMILLQDMSCN